MMASITAKLLAIDQRLKAIDPHNYNRSLIFPSCIVIALMLVWLFVFGFGTLPVRLANSIWALSAVFVGFSFAGISTIWRTRHSAAVKLGLLLLHLAAVMLFLTPLGFALWFINGMAKH